MTKQDRDHGPAAETSVPLYSQTNLKIIFSVTLMAVLGVASITPAFPKIAESLGISTKEIGLLITLFTFPGIILTPVLGVLADRLGRKRILVPSLLLFGVAGGACAFAPDFHTLLVLRFFQGIGAAALGALNTTVIGDLYSGPQLSEAMGYNAGVLNIGTATYPAIGGLLASLNWHYPFLLPVVAIPIGFVVLFSLKNPEPEGSQSLKEYLKNTWESVRNKQIFGLFTASFVTFVVLYGAALTYFPFFMKTSFGSSAVVIGLMMTVMSIASGITAMLLGRLNRLFSPKSLIFCGFILYTVSLSMVPYSPTVWFLILPAALYGIANGLNIPNIMALLARLSPLEYRAALMGANGMVLRLGQTVGPLVMALVFGLWGLGATFLAGAALCAMMLVLIRLMIK